MTPELQPDTASDYFVATDEAHAIRQFVGEAFGYADSDWEEHVASDPRIPPPIRRGHIRRVFNAAPLPLRSMPYTYLYG